MPAFFKIKNRNPDAAVAYAAILRQVRQPGFYTHLNVPDTLEGRFDLMLAHVFIVLQGIEGAPGARVFGQALFDAVFADMDQLLRESGIGDMGVPKRMRRMMTAFNGRMNAYKEGMKTDSGLEGALIRNLYGALDGPGPENVKNMELYMHESVQLIAAQATNVIGGGEVGFAANPF